MTDKTAMPEENNNDQPLDLSIRPKTILHLPYQLSAPFTVLGTFKDGKFIPASVTPASPRLPSVGVSVSYKGVYKPHQLVFPSVSVGDFSNQYCVSKQTTTRSDLATSQSTYSTPTPSRASSSIGGCAPPAHSVRCSPLYSKPGGNSHSIPSYESTRSNEPTFSPLRALLQGDYGLSNTCTPTVAANAPKSVVCRNEPSNQTSASALKLANSPLCKTDQSESLQTVSSSSAPSVSAITTTNSSSYIPSGASKVSPVMISASSILLEAAIAHAGSLKSTIAHTPTPVTADLNSSPATVEPYNNGLTVLTLTPAAAPPSQSVKRKQKLISSGEKSKRQRHAPKKCINPSCCPSLDDRVSAQPATDATAKPAVPTKRKRVKKAPKSAVMSIAGAMEAEEVSDATKSVLSPQQLEKLYREAMACVTNSSSGQNEVDEAIRSVLTSSQPPSDELACTSQQQSTPSGAQEKKLLASPTSPQLSSDHILRINELCAPDNLPSQADKHLADMRIIRPAVGPYMDPEATTLRCISNYDVYACAGNGSYQYNDGGDNYCSPVTDLPVPSMWSARHALMPVAPCISSPGFYDSQKSLIPPPPLPSMALREGDNSHSPVVLDDDDDIEYNSTDSEEVFAIY